MKWRVFIVFLFGFLIPCAYGQAVIAGSKYSKHGISLSAFGDNTYDFALLLVPALFLLPTIFALYWIARLRKPMAWVMGISMAMLVVVVVALEITFDFVSGLRDLVIGVMVLSFIWLCIIGVWLLLIVAKKTKSAWKDESLQQIVSEKSRRTQEFVTTTRKMATGKFTRHRSDLDNQVDAPNVMSMTDDGLYGLAWKELDSKRPAEGLYARIYSECEGDEDATRVRYLQERVKELQDLRTTQQHNTETQSDDGVNCKPQQNTETQSDDGVNRKPPVGNTIERKTPWLLVLVWLTVLFLFFLICLAILGSVAI